MKPTKNNIYLMLRESNAIEGVYDRASLVHAKRAFNYLLMFDTMNTQIVKHAHKLLMTDKRDIEEKHKGAWRTIPVWIGGKKKSDPPLIIEEKMKAWCKKTMSVDRNFDPVALHVDFEIIHPFVDGNGRMGRMLLNWHLLKLNNAPLLIYTEADAATYYRLFPTFKAKEHKKMMADIMEFVDKELI